MKKTLFKALALLMGVAMSTALIACGSDDDEPKVPDTTKEIASYEITYLADPSQAYLNFYDLTWSYTDSNGETKTEALTEKKSLDINVPANVMPSEASITIHAKLKEPIPAHNEESVYEFSYSAQILVNRVFTDKSVEIVGGELIPNRHSLSVKGDKITTYFDKYSDFNLFSKTVSVK